MIDMAANNARSTSSGTPVTGGDGSSNPAGGGVREAEPPKPNRGGVFSSEKGTHLPAGRYQIQIRRLCYQIITSARRETLPNVFGNARPPDCKLPGRLALLIPPISDGLSSATFLTKGENMSLRGVPDMCKFINTIPVQISMVWYAPISIPLPLHQTLLFA